MTNKFDDPLESTLSEMYIEEISLIANVIPYVGGVVSGLANDFVSSRKNARLGEFLKNLYYDLEHLKEKISEDKGDDEEFRNLVEDIFDKASACRQQAKLDAFRALFVNVTIANCPDYDEALEVAGLIDRWQDRHIVLLKVLDNPWESTGEDKNNMRISMGSINSTLRIVLKWDDEQIVRTWKELYSDSIINTQETKVTMSVSGAAALEHRLTTFGHRVANYVNNPISS